MSEKSDAEETLDDVLSSVNTIANTIGKSFFIRIFRLRPKKIMVSILIFSSFASFFVSEISEILLH